jgi:hypothetical protein
MCAAETGFFEQSPVPFILCFDVRHDPAYFGEGEKIFQTSPYKKDHIFLDGQRR